MRFLFRIAVCTVLAAAACLPVAAATVEGTILYEKIPATTKGLDTARPVNVPVAQVRVELRDAEDPSTIVAEGVTDDGGRCRFEVPDESGPVFLAVWAESGKVQVGDPTNNRLHGVFTGDFDPAQVPQIRIVVPDRGRLSGPFNILEAIRRANRFLAQIDPSLPLAETDLIVFWSPTFREIPPPGITHFRFDRNIAYVQGIREEDSDEFDDAVIIHEYAHYLAARFSRDESPGGEHFLGEQVDPRLAWSEGWAHFFATAVLGSPIFVDTMGPGGADVFGFDVDQDVIDGHRPGYWNEHSVASVLWDIFADSGTGSGNLGLGFSPIWDVFRNHFPRQVFPYLITLADGLILGDGSRQDGVADALARRDIEYRFGVVPPVAVPFPRLISPGAPVTGSVDSLTTQRHNLLQSAEYYLFRIEGERDVDIRLKVTSSAFPSSADLRLVLYNDRRSLVAFADSQRGVGTVERIARRLPAGTYIIGVMSFAGTQTGIRWGTARYELTAKY